MHHQRACRKEPARGSPLGRYAGRPPLTPGLKLEIRPYRADARSVSSSTPPANEGDVARVGGLDRCHVAGRNRSTFPGAWDEANVRYPPLIGHTATASELDFGHFRPADPVGRGRSFVSDIVQDAVIDGGAVDCDGEARVFGDALWIAAPL